MIEKFSEGNWYIEKDDKYSLHGIWSNNIDSFPTYIAITCFAPNSEANAKLIAAAPKMYNELKILLDTLGIVHASDEVRIQKLIDSIN